MKKVSVILTTYNGERTIEKTIQSILNQEGINQSFALELIVVDDCSVDKTVDIVKKYPVSLFSTEKNSGGPNRGRNIGLTHATGDYITIADHDDVWNEHRIITVLPYLEKVPIVTSGYTLIDTIKNKETDRVKQGEKGYIFFPKNQTFLKKLSKSLSGQNTYLGSIVYRSELKNILFEEHFGVVDFDWILRLFHENESIEVCDSLYKRFVKGSNLSLNENYRRKDFYYSLLFIENYLSAYPREVRIAYKKIHGSRARYYYLMDKMKEARFYFLRSGFSLKMIAYYLTTFAGSSYVRKKFNIFG